MNLKLQSLYLKIILLLIFTANIYAENIYPLSYKLHEKFDSGELLISEKEDGQPIFYFIKHDWLNVSTYLSIWWGLEPEVKKGNIFPDTDFLSSKIIGDKLLSLIWRNRLLQFVEVNQNAEITKVASIPLYDSQTKPRNIQWYNDGNNEYLLLLVDDKLYEIGLKAKNIDITFISDLVLTAAIRYIPKSKIKEIIYLLDKSTGRNLIFQDSSSYIIARIPVFDYNRCMFINDSLIALLSSNSGFNSLINIIHIQKGIISSFWLESEYDKINFIKENDGLKLYCLLEENDNYKFQIIDFSKLSPGKIEVEQSISSEFISPRILHRYHSNFFIMFLNGIINIDINGRIQSSDKIPIADIFNETPEIFVSGKLLILSSNSYSTIYKSEKIYFWWLNKFIYSSGKYIIPISLLLIILILIQSLRHQKRLLQELIELPANSAVIVMNKSGKLFIINDFARKIFGVDKSVRLGKNFEYYFVKQEFTPIKELIDLGFVNKEMISKRISMMINGDSKEWLCSVVPMRNIAGHFRGLIFTGIDITEQLERRRLFNWAQLLHDMQTNLSTIRLNAEQLSLENQQDAIRKSKILHQVNILTNRVRDIVTVGRTDFADFGDYYSEEICKQALSEFDENMYPNIKFTLKAENFKLKCDKPKFVRALRNVIENAIRAIKDKENGKIEVLCSKDLKNAYFSVRDNGVGMDEFTKNKILQPYFTTSKDTGGSGIGTMIIQRVLELHSGKIVINSEKNVGTEITLIIPLLQKK